MIKNTTFNSRIYTQWFLASLAISGIFIALIKWFSFTNVYYNHFFDHGTLIIFYSIARVLFIGFIIWFIWSIGATLLRLVSPNAMLIVEISPLDRFLLGFLVGTGILQIILFAIGLAGLLNSSFIFLVTLFTLFLSGPHLYSIINKIPGAVKLLVTAKSFRSAATYAMLAVGIAIMALFIATKGLYPAGGHDYYTHYFQYYLSVIRNESILPNDVWYHFYYSKGAGLYFWGMLLTDPLAPQLVTTSFIFVGALIIYSLLSHAVGGRFLPWLGSILYVALLVYTPGPKENMVQGGWGDLEKVHEPAAVLFLSIVWITAQFEAANLASRKVWLLALCSAIAAASLFSTAVAFFIGAYLSLTTLWWLVKRNWVNVKAMLVACIVCAAAILIILYVNYFLTGLPLDQFILYFWSVSDLEKVNRWGALNEVLVLHWALTGYLANKVPLTWEIFPLVGKYLRLEIWWPVYILGFIATAYSFQINRWKAFNRSTDYIMAFRSLSILFGMFVLFAIGLGAGRQQPISFYRFSSFMYGPMLCLGLLLCALWPVNLRNRRKSRFYFCNDGIGSYWVGGQFPAIAYFPWAFRVRQSTRHSE